MMKLSFKLLALILLLLVLRIRCNLLFAIVKDRPINPKRKDNKLINLCT